MGEVKVNQKEKIKELIEAGITDAQELAEQAGAKLSYVYKIKGESEIPKESEKLKELIIAYLNMGKKPAEVARLVKKSRAYVGQVRAKYLYQYNYSTTPIQNDNKRGRKKGRAGESERIKELIIKYLKEGLKPAEIAEKINRSKTYVMQMNAKYKTEIENAKNNSKETNLLENPIKAVETEQEIVNQSASEWFKGYKERQVSETEERIKELQSINK